MSTVRAIFVAPAAKAPMRCVPSIEAIAGEGLAGDRYQKGIGAFSRWPGEGRQITLIEDEALTSILAETGIDLSDGRHRRNVITQGVALDALVGKVFTIGSVRLRGQRRCAPCRYLDRLIDAEVYESMKGRGGLRAEILVGGMLHVGDAVTG